MTMNTATAGVLDMGMATTIITNAIVMTTIMNTKTDTTAMSTNILIQLAITITKSHTTTAIRIPIITMPL